ncbi:hypothetical protein LZ30DRAFT_315267 [Colletotrichum cereale]|nr:hypothetical protein LZ30DRAFT_315267 [Colletotrichum cereale]
MEPESLILCLLQQWKAASAEVSIELRHWEGEGSAPHPVRPTYQLAKSRQAGPSQPAELFVQDSAYQEPSSLISWHICRREIPEVQPPNSARFQAWSVCLSVTRVCIFVIPNVQQNTPYCARSDDRSPYLDRPATFANTTIYFTLPPLLALRQCLAQMVPTQYSKLREQLGKLPLHPRWFVCTSRATGNGGTRGLGPKLSRGKWCTGRAWVGSWIAQSGNRVAAHLTDTCPPPFHLLDLWPSQKKRRKKSSG